MNNEKMKKFGFTRKILDDFQPQPTTTTTLSPMAGPLVVGGGAQ